MMSNKWLEQMHVFVVITCEKEIHNHSTKVLIENISLACRNNHQYSYSGISLKPTRLYCKFLLSCLSSYKSLYISLLILWSRYKSHKVLQIMKSAPPTNETLDEEVQQYNDCQYLQNKMMVSFLYLL